MKNQFYCVKEGGGASSEVYSSLIPGGYKWKGRSTRGRGAESGNNGVEGPSRRGGNGDGVGVSKISYGKGFNRINKKIVKRACNSEILSKREEIKKYLRAREKLEESIVEIVEYLENF